MKLFDTHTHLNVENFQGREQAMIDEARANDVHYMAVVGFDYPTIEKSLALSNQYQGIISVCGWHPTEAHRYDAKVEAYLESLMDHPQVKMLGEIGLDYYWDTATPEQQAKAFRRQIAIAKAANLPITIHNRDATEDCYRILKEEGLPEAGGIMHSFGDNAQWAQKFLDLGMHLSFSGVVTFKKTDDVRQAAKIVPKDKLLIETDAPYLAPVPMRGKENQPAYVKYVAQVLAQTREVALEDIAQQTTDNAMTLFNWQG